MEMIKLCLRLVKVTLLRPVGHIFALMWEYGGYENYRGDETTDEEIFAELNWMGKIGIRGCMWVTRRLGYDPAHLDEQLCREDFEYSSGK